MSNFVLWYQFLTLLIEYFKQLCQRVCYWHYFDCYRRYHYARICKKTTQIDRKC